MKMLRRTGPLKRAQRMRSLGRMRIDAAAELPRLQYRKARLSGGLAQADDELVFADERVAWVLHCARRRRWRNKQFRGRHAFWENIGAFWLAERRGQAPVVACPFASSRTGADQTGRSVG